MKELTLRPMTVTEYGAFYSKLVREYAAAGAGNITSSYALGYEHLHPMQLRANSMKVPAIS